MPRCCARAPESTWALRHPPSRLGCRGRGGCCRCSPPQPFARVPSAAAPSSWPLASPQQPVTHPRKQPAGCLQITGLLARNEPAPGLALHAHAARTHGHSPTRVCAEPQPPNHPKTGWREPAEGWRKSRGVTGGVTGIGKLWVCWVALGAWGDQDVLSASPQGWHLQLGGLPAHSWALVPLPSLPGAPRLPHLLFPPSRLI